MCRCRQRESRGLLQQCDPGKSCVNNVSASCCDRATATTHTRPSVRVESRGLESPSVRGRRCDGPKCRGAASRCRPVTARSRVALPGARVLSSVLSSASWSVSLAVSLVVAVSMSVGRRRDPHPPSGGGCLAWRRGHSAHLPASASTHALTDAVATVHPGWGRSWQTLHRLVSPAFLHPFARICIDLLMTWNYPHSET